jgi:hypothetical protein
LSAAHGCLERTCRRIPQPGRLAKNQMKDMALPIQHRSMRREPGECCVTCGHLESEHGALGTRPCLAKEGEQLDWRFCPCDEFQPRVTPVLPTADVTATQVCKPHRRPEKDSPTSFACGLGLPVEHRPEGLNDHR